MNNISCIYRIINSTNGKTYIGSTSDLTSRQIRHWWELENNRHHNQHLQRSYNKYGANSFSLKVLEYCKVEILIEREQEHFDIFVKRAGRQNIYNTGDFVENSMRGKSPSQETRRKLSEAQRGEKNHMWGKRHSEKTKKRMSEAHSNPSEEARRTMSANSKNKRPVLQLDKNTGEILAKFDSITSARKQTSLGLHISCCCSGKRKTAGGFKWRYYDDTDS